MNMGHNWCYWGGEGAILRIVFHGSSGQGIHSWPIVFLDPPVWLIEAPIGLHSRWANINVPSRLEFQISFKIYASNIIIIYVKK